MFSSVQTFGQLLFKPAVFNCFEEFTVKRLVVKILIRLHLLLFLAASPDSETASTR